MLFSVVGRFTPPQDESWRGLSLDPDRFAWLEGGPVLTGEQAPGFGTAGDFVDALATDAPPEFFVHIDFGEDVEVIGRFEFPDVFEQVSQDLVTVMRCMGEAGARGELMLLAPDDAFGWRIGVGTDSTIEPFEGEALFDALEPHLRGVQMGHRVAEARQKDPDVDIAAVVANERTLHLGDVDPPPRRAALDALRALDLQTVLDAAARHETTTSSANLLAEHFPDVTRLQAALDAGDPEVRASAIVLVAAVQREAAEAMAAALLEDVSPYVRGAAAEALALAGTSTAIERLLTPPPLDAPESHRRARAVRYLPEDAELPIVARWQAAVKASAQAGEPSTDAGLSAAWKLGYLTDVLVARPSDDAGELLLGLFDDAPHLGARGIAFSGLQRVGGPAVEGAAERLQAYMFGMGLALNQDDARRRALLGIEADEDSGGIMSFYGLEVDTLETLLEERFIDPGGRQNDAPATIEFFDLMKQYPAIKATGYAVVKERADYRVQLTGIAVALSDVPEDERDAVREVFAELEDTASTADLEDEHLSLWWT